MQIFARDNIILPNFDYNAMQGMYIRTFMFKFLR